MDKELEQIKKENKEYLKNFKIWLQNKELSKKTINEHINNVDLYINDYLCYYDLTPAKEGYEDIYLFFNDWFIRKALWSSCAYIKSTATSIKKFYSFMLENGEISKENYNFLCLIIKESMPDWIDSMKEYDNMSYDD